MDHDTTAAWRIVCLLTLGAFLGLGVTAFATGILPGDLDVRQAFIERNNPVAHQVARVVNEVGTWHVLLPATLILFLLSPAARRHWWLWAVTPIVSSLIENGVKILIGRPRPSGFSFGFPSGHSTAAATFAVILVYVVSREALSGLSRHGIQAVALTVMVLVGWARILLGAHWPTDVLGGFLLGTCCAAAAAWWDSARLDAARRT
ncbi:MAG TPA: phosphatase PAP2 family protein [Candidatus Methylomirabilis sp.]|nr:phosphatase PAP2 family protein [Candidatus Methylomirabilis sp.]